MWERFRANFPVTREWAYFDNAAVAPLPQPAVRAVEKWATEAATQGDLLWGDWCQRIESIRRTAAEMVGADAAEIAFVPNTSAGISLVSEGYPWKAGDNVVIPDNEFPANVYPWLHLAARGVETRRVPQEGGQLQIDRLLEAIDGRTRIVSCSWVGYASGWRTDVTRLVEGAHARGALVFLDAIQGLGVFPLDVRETGVDFFAADGHKWLLGPEGAGIFFVRRSHLDLLRPTQTGWNSVQHPFDYTNIRLRMRDTATRFEPGSANTVGVLALGASLDLLTEFGLASTQSRIAEQVLAITDLACEKLASAGATMVSNRDPAGSSGIVVFDVPGADNSALRKRCLDSGVVLSLRNGFLRISPHAFNDESDIDALIAVLRGKP